MSYVPLEFYEQIHLTTRAVEWLRAEKWNHQIYATPGGEPACWGRLFPDRLELQPLYRPWARSPLFHCYYCGGTGRVRLNRQGKEVEGRVRVRTTALFCSACRGHGTIVAPYLPESSMAGLYICAPADVRAMVRAMTGGSGTVWTYKFGEREERPLHSPTCEVCATLLDVELAATRQNWDVAREDFEPARRESQHREFGALADDLLTAIQNW